MDSNKINIPLTASEVGFLWNAYQNETLSFFTFKHFEKVTNDSSILKDIQYSLEMSQKHIQKLTDLFNSESFPVPVGITEHDVNLDAPKLFSDTTAIYLLKFISEACIKAHAGGLGLVAREDIRAFANECLNSYAALNNRITQTLLNSGLYVRPPQIPIPENVDFVKKQSYLTGWFGERRPIHAAQITHLFLNIQRNMLGKTFFIGFIQTTKSDKLRKHLETGKNHTEELLDSFQLFLKDVDLNVSIPADLTVTSSTLPPFSDKLILELLNITIRNSISAYGDALSISTRHDLFAFYSKTITEATLYVNQSIKLAIELGYLEEQPKAIDHKDLVK